MKAPQEYLRDLVYLAAGKTTPTDDLGNALLATPGLAIQDVSQFNLETTTALGGSATYTGSLRDTTSYNWLSGSAFSNVAGTLKVDEAEDAAGANGLYEVQTVATAALAGSSPTAGQYARLTPVKNVLRYVRMRYVNGATGQTSFRLNSSLSPLN